MAVCTSSYLSTITAQLLILNLCSPSSTRIAHPRSIVVKCGIKTHAATRPELLLMYSRCGRLRHARLRAPSLAIRAVGCCGRTLCVCLCWLVGPRVHLAVGLATCTCGLRQLPQAWCEARPSMLLPRHSEDQRRRAGLYGAVHDSALAILGCNTRRRPRSATTPRWLSCRRTKHAPILEKCMLLVRESAWFSTPPGGMVICAAACERLAKASHGTEIAAA